MTKLDTRFRILVLAIMDLNDQELSIVLEEFERTMVDVSELFLPQLENRLDRAIIGAAVESGAMRFAMSIFIFTSSAKRLFEIPKMLCLVSKHALAFNSFHV